LSLALLRVSDALPEEFNQFVFRREVRLLAGIDLLYQTFQSAAASVNTQKRPWMIT